MTKIQISFKSFKIGYQSDFQQKLFFLMIKNTILIATKYINKDKESS